MRIAATIVALLALGGCGDKPELPQANGPMLTWNTAMWGVAAPLASSEVVPPGTPMASAIVGDR